MTDLENKIIILSDLYINYRDDKEFKDFIEYNDIGLPLSYLLSENLCQVTDIGVVYIEETWNVFLASLEIEDEGFESLEDVLATAQGS